MTVLNLREAASVFAKDPAVISKVAENDEFSISAGVMADQDIPEKAQYKKLADAIGHETPLFRFKPSKQGSEIPLAQGPSVFVDSSGQPVILTPGMTTIDAKFESHRLGVRGYALAKVGTVTIEVDIRVADELVKEIRDQKACAPKGENPTFHFEMTKGAPTAMGMVGDVETRAIRLVPQREIPPHSDDVPLKTELKVVDVLPDPTRNYGEPRLLVANTATGEVINGLIATAPIRDCIGTRNSDGAYEITDAAVGTTFEILECYTKKTKDGKEIQILDDKKNPVLDLDGNPRFQQKVIVRRTNVKGLSL